MNEQLFATPVQPLDSDERYTPAWVFDGMGLTFDTDPCSPQSGSGCVPVHSLGCRWTAADDGLTQPWNGLVWCNPPFSNATAWADRFRSHGNGVFLGPIANARWSHDLIAAADTVWLCRDFAFWHPTHAGRRSSMPLFFAAIGERGTVGLTKLAKSGVHDGNLVRPI